MAKTFGRYLIFYIVVGALYGIYAELFDLVFSCLEYGTAFHYYYPLSFIFYLYVLLAYFFLITFPVCLIYNLVINFGFANTKLKMYRYVFGLLVGACIGYLVHGSGWSFYIGEYRPLKNIVVFMLTGLSVEIIRTIIVHRRYPMG